MYGIYALFFGFYSGTLCIGKAFQVAIKNVIQANSK